MLIYNPQNWYWIVGGDKTRVYSGASGNYVPAIDATYQTWLKDNNEPTAVDTPQDLGQVLWPYNLRPVDPDVLDGYQTGGMDAIERAQFRLSFNQENRIRTLEGRAQLTAQQFLAGIKNLL